MKSALKPGKLWQTTRDGHAPVLAMRYDDIIIKKFPFWSRFLTHFWLIFYWFFASSDMAALHDHPYKQYTKILKARDAGDIIPANFLDFYWIFRQIFWILCHCEGAENAFFWRFVSSLFGKLRHLVMVLHASMPSLKWSKFFFCQIRFRPYTFIIRGLDFFFNFADLKRGGSIEYGFFYDFPKDFKKSHLRHITCF